jgi:hypothetical protein
VDGLNAEWNVKSILSYVDRYPLSKRRLLLVLWFIGEVITLPYAVFGPALLAELVCRFSDFLVRYPLTVYLLLKIRPPPPVNKVNGIHKVEDLAG